jgi:hypothetical protein
LQSSNRANQSSFNWMFLLNLSSPLLLYTNDMHI